MRITGLSMDGFGLFNGVTVRGLPSGLTLLLGDNEAGKSTTLGFVHTVLFGYADGRRSERAYPPLNGGTPGGRLMLDTDTYGGITVERRKGPKGGKVTATHADGRVGGSEELAALLGGINGKLYRNLYGFSLSELQTIETLTSEDVRDVIYGASLGTGLRTLPDARKRLEKRMSDLFRSGGSNPEINRLLKEVDETRKGLVEAQHGIDAYEAAGQDIAALSRTIDESRDALRTDRERLAHLESLLRVWDDWIGLQEARSQLEALELRVEEFPTDGLLRSDRLNGDLGRERQELESARGERDGKRQQLDGLVFDERLLAQSAELAGLLQGLEAYEQAERAIPAAGERAAGRDGEARRVLTELGAGWSEKRALALDISVHVREEISSHKNNLERTRQQATTRRLAVEAAETALEAANEEVARSGERVVELEGAGLDVSRELLEKLRNGKEQYGSFVNDLPRREENRRVIGEALTRTLCEIHPDWTVETLEALDVSLTGQQQIEQYATSLEEAETHVRDQRGAVANADKAFEKLEQEVEQKRLALRGSNADVESVSNLEHRRAQGLELRRKLRTWAPLQTELNLQEGLLAAAESRAKSEALPGIGSRLGMVAALLAALGALAGLALWWLDQPLWVAALTVGLSITVAGALLWLRQALAAAATAEEAQDPGALRQRIETLRSQRQELASVMDTLAAQVGMPEGIAGEDADRALDEMDACIERLEERLRLAQSIEELAGQSREAREERDRVEGEFETAEETLSMVKANWNRHALSLSLPPNISPRTTDRVFAKAEKARGEKQRLDEMATRIEKIQVARDAYTEVMAQVPRLQAARNRGDQALHAELLAFLAEMDRQEDQLRALEKARSGLEDNKTRSGETEDKLGVARKAITEAEAAHASVEAAWRTWLEDHDMNVGWSPETAAHALDRAARIAELTGDRDSATAEARRLQTELEAYQRRAAAVFQALERPSPGNDQLLLELRRLEEERARNDKAHILHSQLTTDCVEAERLCEEREKRIGGIEAEREGLLEAGGAKNEETFRLRGEAHARYLTLVEESETRASNIRRISGTQDPAALERELGGTIRDRLSAEQAEFKSQIEEADERVGQALEDRGASERTQRTLYSDDQVARLRAEEEGLLEEIRTLARDWARHAVAGHLLDTAKERHAQANQPRVIQEASKYFELMTHGRYTRVFAPPGENRTEVIDADGRTKDADDLSRGAQEQLYLAIRFGYIAAQAAGAEPVPILMDDVLVNFDPGRASAAASAILELADTRQVLFFTCHPAMVEVFRTNAPEVPVYQIEGANIVRLAS